MSRSVLPTRQRLRHRAAELFASRGYGGTSMSQIAERVGVSKASLYNYYPSKEELLLDLLQRSLEAWEERSLPLLAGPGSCQQRLEAYLRTAVGLANRQSQATRIIRLAATQVGGDLGRRAHAILAHHEERWIDILQSFFREAIERRELPPGDPLQLSLFLGALVDGLLVNRLFASVKSRQSAGRLPELWAMFWRGAGGRAAEEVEP